MIKIGIIGTGVGIRTHLKGFRNFSDKAEVIAIAGSSLERSEEFAKQYEIPIACGDYHQLCDIESLDLVCITAPNRFHKDMLEYAMSKHLNIICEKPIVDSKEDLDHIIQFAKEYDKILIIDHQLRFNPYIMKIKEMIDNGDLGSIYSVRLHQQGMGFANPDAPWSWSFDGNEGGGVRLAMASHFTDLISYWFDERDVIDVVGSMNPITKLRKNAIGVETTVNASTTCDAFIRLKDELTVHYSINAGAYSGSRFDIDVFGDKGEIHFDLQDKLSYYRRVNAGSVEKVEVNNVYDDEKQNKASIFSGSFRYLAPLLIEAVSTGNRTPISIAATPDNYYYCLRILEAIKESANKSTIVSFGKEENQYV